MLGYVDDVLLLPGLIWLTLQLLPPDVLTECRGPKPMPGYRPGAPNPQHGRAGAGGGVVAVGGDRFVGVVAAPGEG